MKTEVRSRRDSFDDRLILEPSRLQPGKVLIRCEGVESPRSVILTISEAKRFFCRCIEWMESQTPERKKGAGKKSSKP